MRSRFFFFVVMCLVLGGCGAFIESTYQRTSSDQRVAPDGQGLVIFIRPRAGDIFWNIPAGIFEQGGKLITGLPRGAHVAVPTTPGRHVYYVVNSGLRDPDASVVVAEVEAGKVYFVGVNLAMGESWQPSQQQASQIMSTAGPGAGYVAFGGSRAAASAKPLGIRFGQSQEEIERLLKETDAVEVDAEGVRKFTEDRAGGPYWNNIMKAGDAAAAALHDGERQTLHGSDAFETTLSSRSGT